MIVTCPNCTTRYNLPDDKVPPGGAKVKCSKCAHVFKAELPPATPEEEVETLLEEDSPAPDSGVGDEFDETFDEVASGGQETAEVPGDESGDESVPEEQPSTEDAGGDADLDDLFGDDEPEEDLPGVDDLFDDAESTPEPEEKAASSDDSEASADDMDSLFDDDEGDLFADDGEAEKAPEEPSEESADDMDDLFGDDDSEESGADDLFADDDEGEDEGDVDDLFADDEETDDDDESEEDETDEGFGLDEEPKKKGGKSLGCLIILLVVALLLGVGIFFKAWTWFGIDLAAYFQNVPYVGKMFMEETGGGEEAAPGESPADRVRKIELKNVKQYYVANEKTGNLFVVEGKAINKFAMPKERVKVEVVLYDGSGNVLTSQSFLCGNVLSQFQLQVQTQKEIEDGLSSEVGILSNNTFIRPGASTPFMAVFFEPPQGVKEFLVKVVDVGDPE